MREVVPGRHRKVVSSEIHKPGPLFTGSGSPRPILGRPDIGTIRCAHRLQPTCGGAPVRL